MKYKIIISSIIIAIVSTNAESIDGYVWNDTNNNNIYDNDESYLDNFKVKLYQKGDSSQTLTTRTKDGKYEFDIPNLNEKYRLNFYSENNTSADGLKRAGKALRSKYLYLEDLKNYANVGIIPKSENSKTAIETVSTFNSISVYWDHEKIDDSVTLSYQENNEDNALKHKALPLIYNPIKEIDKNSSKASKDAKIMSQASYRGSIVNLKPNTSYTIFVNENQTTKATTWAETNTLTTETATLELKQNKTLKITDIHNGEANLYKVIDGKDQNVGNGKKYNIHIDNAKYIIVQNFNLENATEHAIDIKNSHHIIIRNNNIHHWGSKQKKKNSGTFIDNPNFAHEQDSGVYIEGDSHAIVIERNHIHDPQCPSNRWTQPSDKKGTYHPRGAQGVTIAHDTADNIVIRFNTFDSKENYFNDVIGSNGNHDYHAFPPNSDIYGNYIADANDDAIEADGGVENVRIWNNYITNTYSGISNTVVTVGPLYIWRNRAKKVNELDKQALKSIKNKKKRERTYGAFIKMGATNGYKGRMLGYTYIFNNTIKNSKSIGYGGIGTGGESVNKPFSQSNRIMKYVISQNNFIHVRENISPISKTRLEYNNHTYNYLKSGTRRVKDSQGNTISRHKGQCIPNVIPPKEYHNNIIEIGSGKITTGISAKFTPPKIVECN